MNNLNDYAVELVRNMIKENENEIGKTCYRDIRFECLSYTTAVLKEILSRLESNVDTSPITIIQDYREQMSNYTFYTEKGIMMCLIACDISNDIFYELNDRRRC